MQTRDLDKLSLVIQISRLHSFLLPSSYHPWANFGEHIKIRNGLIFSQLAAGLFEIF